MSFLGVPGFVHAQYDLQARSATRNTRNLLRAARIVRDRLERAKTNVTCCHLLPAKKNVSNEPRGDHKKQLAQIRRASETIAHLRNVQLLCLLHMFLEGCVVPSSAVPVSRWSQKKKNSSGDSRSSWSYLPWKEKNDPASSTGAFAISPPKQSALPPQEQKTAVVVRDVPSQGSATPTVTETKCMWTLAATKAHYV